ncbi:MAG: AmmeMemoRadiSam system radical SAM enzyme [Methanomassiliicoccus sp.]|nr:AmmeMemoRadiSam system radical SAM enzyme [Methanomassiliicoccus sp.]
MPLADIVMSMGPAEARWWHTEGDRVGCDLCPHRCAMDDGEVGRCGARQNEGGRLISLTYGQVYVKNVDPIEKKPIFHYRPGTRVLSLGTFGCNLGCRFCQNAVLAQPSGRELPHQAMRPQEVVDLAEREGVQGLAWTFNEPIMWSEFIIDTARLARAKGIYTMINTNGYILPGAAGELLDHVQVANIDVKGFTDDHYRKVCGGSLQEVLDTCALARSKGVHVEITCLLVPGLNDSEGEVTALCRWLVDALGPDTPLFFYRFHPSHQLTGLPEQSTEVMERAYTIARGEGARYVYFGGAAGGERQDTLCPSCGFLAVERKSVRSTDKVCVKGQEISRFCPTFARVTAAIDAPRCPRCGTDIAVWLSGW